MSDYDILNVPETATDAEIRAAYKRMVQHHHPDKGGDVHTFQMIVKAYKRLSKKPCSSCEGSGKVRVRDGSFFTTINCPACWDEDKQT